jgi:hypothetical protein
MFIRCSHVVALAVVLALLPACGKKKKAGDTTDPPPDPTPSVPGTEYGQQGSGTSGSWLPAPPAAVPHYQRPDARTKIASENNLRQIAIAMHNFESSHGKLPQGYGDASGKLGLSWRVAILPYIEDARLNTAQLYRQFKLDEPWDSEHNKKLIAQMPKVYAPPGVDTYGYTYYRSFSGPTAVMIPPRTPLQPGQPVLGLGVHQIPDGASNTLLVAEATEPVIWTKPDDLPFEPGKPPKLGGRVYANGFFAARCDGATVFIPSTIDPQTLSNLIQTNDGQIVQLPP